MDNVLKALQAVQDRLAEKKAQRHLGPPDDPTPDLVAAIASLASIVQQVVTHTGGTVTPGTDTVVWGS